MGREKAMPTKANDHYEIRCPVHGFISINDWERLIIAEPAFQRLRRIRQLAWTDQVYPGAMHTRFEHSLGVMHVADQMYTSIIRRSEGLLHSELEYKPAGIERDRALVRLAALLHDVGHSPFSHASEELFPRKASGSKRYKHEEYSAKIIRTQLRGAIEDHPLNKRNYDISADRVASLVEGSSEAGTGLFWRELISGQMDADRMDYLLRDSLHAGVDYGKFDWRRLLNTMCAVRASENGVSAEGSGLKLGIEEGGVHAAESLVLARYYMFNQVYFHKTRVAYDHHLQQALVELLGESGGTFPAPTDEGIEDFLRWDDWRVLGLLQQGKGGEHGKRLCGRDHFREVYHTSDSPTAAELRLVKEIKDTLGARICYEGNPAKSWYKIDLSDITVASSVGGGAIKPLSECSAVVQGLPETNRILLFADLTDADAARTAIRQLSGGVQ